MSTIQNKKHRLFDYKVLLSVFGIFLFSLTVLRSAFYGLASPDESFYLSIPYRLICGDSLLADEWHASQFSAFLLYLPMKIYLSVNGSTDGIVLFFRCLFVFCQTLVSYFTFFMVKKNYGTLAGFISSVIFLLYVPETVNMLDYYTMSLMGFQVVTLILFCSDKLSAFRLIFVGIVFACAVVAQPFNCFIYFLYTIAFIVYESSLKKKERFDYCKKFLSFKSWLLITAGIVLVAAVFSGFLFSRMTLHEFINNIGNLFGGSDHTLPFAETGKTDMFSYATIINTLKRVAPIGFYITVCPALLLSFLLLYNKSQIKSRKIWLTVFLVTITVSIFECVFMIFTDTAALLFRPYILFVFTSVLLVLLKEKDKNLTMILWSGIFYLIFLGLISQALDYVGVIGLVISNTAFLPAVIQIYRQLQRANRKEDSAESKTPFTARLLCIVCAIAVIFEITTGTAIKFVDEPFALAVSKETITAETTLSTGPLKGIKTTNQKAETYYNIIDDTVAIKNNSCEKVLVASLVPWIYFCFDDSPATFTTWYIQEEFNLYDEYYKNKNHLPQCIYILDSKFYWTFDYTDSCEEHKEFFSEMFTVSEHDGKAGYIMYVEDSPA